MNNVDELRPPPEHADKPLHWLLHEAEGAPECFQWVPSHEWVMHGSSVFFKPERMAGYRYLGPAEWRNDNGRGTYPTAQSPEMGVLGLRAATAEARVAELEAENDKLRARNGRQVALIELQLSQLANATLYVGRLEASIAGLEAEGTRLRALLAAHEIDSGDVPAASVAETEAFVARVVENEDVWAQVRKRMSGVLKAVIQLSDAQCTGLPVPDPPSPFALPVNAALAPKPPPATHAVPIPAQALKGRP